MENNLIEIFKRGYDQLAYFIKYNIKNKATMIILFIIVSNGGSLIVGLTGAHYIAGYMK